MPDQDYWRKRMEEEYLRFYSIENEGMIARRDNQSIEANPHAQATTEWRCWRRGWRDADDMILYP